jgi:hypothetical protein
MCVSEMRWLCIGELLLTRRVLRSVDVEVQG